MYTSPKLRLRVISWVVTFLLPVAAWSAARFTLPFFHSAPGAYFIAAACISAVIGGLPTTLVGILLNTAALNGFIRLFELPGTSRDTTATPRFVRLFANGEPDVLRTIGSLFASGCR